jgi:hypothetical protein
LVQVSWSRSNSSHDVEKLRRNGIAKSMQEIECHKPVVMALKDRDCPPSNSGAINTIGSGEIWDRWIEGKENKGRPMKKERRIS